MITILMATTAATYVEDLGVNFASGLSSYDLTTEFTRDEIYFSADLQTSVDAGDVVLTSGGIGIPNIQAFYDGLIDQLQPYLSSDQNIVLLDNLTSDITIQGDNFDENVSVYFGDEVTINSISVTSPQEMVVNCTTGAVLQPATNIIIKKGSSEHFGETITCTITDVLIGTGSAGTFTIDFDAGGTGQSAWGADWDLEIFGNVNSIDGFFPTGTTTPSGNTGANTVSPQGGNFGFNECSNPNNGAGQYGQATTSNFREVQSIDFYSYMYGSDIGALVVLSQNADNSWTERYRQDGQIQTAQGQAWTTVSIDATSWEAKAIRFLFEASSGYMGDICLDNISITSV